MIGLRFATGDLFPADLADFRRMDFVISSVPIYRDLSRDDRLAIGDWRFISRRSRRFSQNGFRHLFRRNAYGRVFRFIGIYREMIGLRLATGDLFPADLADFRREDVVSDLEELQSLKNRRFSASTAGDRPFIDPMSHFVD
jgi:hypothetical protein